MKIKLAPAQSEISVDLSPHELLVLNECLNEVVNGFGISGHEIALGAPVERISALLSLIHRAARSGTSNTIQISRSDLATLANVVRVAVSELEAEFSVRTGFSIDEAEVVACEIEWYAQSAHSGEALDI